ncbi:hypothetical protein CYMTET_30447 [Cymbomonas tetramitiformis]|uniref:Uncharacterized protein n=1 Tax=Cymbomonas tetramitiformis TaxID=36881 RepID=A0AAE0FIZ5_9CHLO|nr:hypothetical protein CYMTET_30447 [Cymbomonas tetramitiformis]
MRSLEHPKCERGDQEEASRTEEEAGSHLDEPSRMEQGVAAPALRDKSNADIHTNPMFDHAFPHGRDLPPEQAPKAAPDIEEYPPDRAFAPGEYRASRGSSFQTEFSAAAEYRAGAGHYSFGKEAQNYRASRGSSLQSAAGYQLDVDACLGLQGTAEASIRGSAPKRVEMSMKV